MTDEATLVAGLVARDEAAVAQLLERYWARVYKVAFHITGEWAAAEDVTQESFVIALRTVESLENPAVLRSWLFRILENQAKKHLRGETRRERRDQGEPGRARERERQRRSAPVSRDLERRETQEQVREQLETLSPKLRHVLALRYLEDMSLEQVAEVLRIPRKTVSSRIRRGLDSLRGGLQPQVVGANAVLLPGLVSEVLSEVSVPKLPEPMELALAWSDAPVEVPEPSSARDFLERSQGSPERGGALAVGVGIVVLGAVAASLLFAFGPGNPQGAKQAAKQGQEQESPEEPRRAAPSEDGAAQARTADTDAPPDPEEAARTERANEGQVAGVSEDAEPVGAPTLERSYDLGKLPQLAATATLGAGLSPWDNGGSVAALAVVDKSTFLSGDNAGAVKLWSRTSGLPVANLEPAHADHVADVDVSRDRQFALSVGSGELKVWDLAARTLLATHKVDARAGGAVFTPDGAGILVATGSSVVLWVDFTLEAPTQIREFAGHEGRINCLALSRDGAKLVTGSEDETLRAWEVATGRQLASFGCPCDPGDGSRVLSCAISDTGDYVASGGYRGHVAIYDVAQGELLAAGHEGDFVGELVLLAGPEVISVGFYGLFRWAPGADATLTQTKITVPGLAGYPSALALDVGRGRYVVGSAEGQLRELDVQPEPASEPVEEAPEEERAVHKDVITAVALDPHERQLASASLDGTVRLWDLTSGVSQGVLRAEGSSWVTGVDYTADGSKLVSSHFLGDTTGLCVWDPRDGTLLRTLPADRVTDLACDPARSERVVSCGQQVIVWNVDTGEQLRALGEGMFTAVALSADGKHVAAASSSVVRYKSWTMTPGRSALYVWSLETGELLAEHELDVEATQALAFSPDGTQLLSGHVTGELRQWTPALEPVAVLRAHSSTIFDVAFSRDGARFFAASSDRQVSEWSTAGPLRSFSSGSGAVRGLTVGRDVVVGGGDGKSPQVWPLH